MRKIYYTLTRKALLMRIVLSFLFFSVFFSSTDSKPNNQANFIFFPADPLQSFYNNLDQSKIEDGQSKIWLKDLVSVYEN